MTNSQATSHLSVQQTCINLGFMAHGSVLTSKILFGYQQLPLPKYAQPCASTPPASPKHVELQWARDCRRRPRRGEKGGEAGVGCHLDAINSQGSLSDVGRQHNLARSRGRRLKDLGLHVRRQIGIHRRDHELSNLAAQPLRLQLQQLLCSLNLLLAGEEYEYVPCRLRGMNLKCSDDCCVQVVCLQGAAAASASAFPNP